MAPLPAMGGESRPLTRFSHLPAESIDLQIWATCEIAVTMIAACIPVLRVLVRDITSTARRYYHSRSRNGTSDNDDKSRSHNGVATGVLTGWGSAKGNRVTAMAISVDHMDMVQKGHGSPDNWSEENILEDAAPTGRIKQTKEFNIEYGLRKDDISGEYEMGNVSRRSEQ
jgi:hypothetical protein